MLLLSMSVDTIHTIIWSAVGAIMSASVLALTYFVRRWVERVEATNDKTANALDKLDTTMNIIIKDVAVFQQSMIDKIGELDKRLEDTIKRTDCSKRSLGDLKNRVSNIELAHERQHKERLRQIPPETTQ